VDEYYDIEYAIILFIDFWDYAAYLVPKEYPNLVKENGENKDSDQSNPDS
jgi:hypothetical protein